MPKLPTQRAHKSGIVHRENRRISWRTRRALTSITHDSAPQPGMGNRWRGSGLFRLPGMSDAAYFEQQKENPLTRYLSDVLYEMPGQG